MARQTRIHSWEIPLLPGPHIPSRETHYVPHKTELLHAFVERDGHRITVFGNKNLGNRVAEENVEGRQHSVEHVPFTDAELESVRDYFLREENLHPDNVQPYTPKTYHAEEHKPGRGHP